MAATCAALLALTWAPAAAQDTGPTVTMRSSSFAPVEIHVSPGSTVTWTNPSDVGHTVTADDGSFDSGNVDPGQTWSMQFDAPGTYSYYCVPHGAPGGVGMAAVIVVDDTAS